MKRLAAIAIGFSLLATTARAQGAGGESCTLSATPLVFGAYRPMGGSPNDFTATLSIDCRTTTANAAAVRATIALAGPSARRVQSGGQSLSYQLYTNAAHSMPWGAGAGTVVISGIATPTTDLRQTVTVYGRLSAHQTSARVGDYADSVTVMLTY